jgi:hypothetical protein
MATRGSALFTTAMSNISIAVAMHTVTSVPPGLLLISAPCRSVGDFDPQIVRPGVCE